MIAVALVILTLVVQPIPTDGQVLTNELGWLSLPVSVGLYGLCTLLPLPRNLLSVAAGAVFGLEWGLGLAYLGSLLGAGVVFWLARVLGRDAVTNLVGARAATIDARVVRRGVSAVLVARLAPFVPSTAFNYFAGLTGLPWRTYAWGTVVGVVPGTAFYIAVGAFALTPGTYRTEALVGLLLLGTAYVAFRVWRGRRNRHQR